MSRFVLSLVCCCLLNLQACAGPPLSTGHQIDRESDIIIGDMDAKNELILYLSPGDGQSLSFYLNHYKSIKELYVDKNRLRVVIREVPYIVRQGTNTEDPVRRYEEAQVYSGMLGIHLRCAYHYHGIEAYEITWQTIGVSVAKSAVRQGDVSWPYFDREAMQAVFVSMGQEAQMTREEYASCDKKPKKEKFAFQFARHQDILEDVSERNLLPVPAAFFNGEQIEMTRRNKYNELMLVLKENLDPEYALSRN